MITNDIKAKDANDKTAKVEVKPAEVADKKDVTKENEAVKKTV